MLAKAGRVAADAEWRGAEGHGITHGAVAAFARMLGGAEQTNCLDVRVLRKVSER